MKMKLTQDVTAEMVAVDSHEGVGYAKTDVIGPRGTTVEVVTDDEGDDQIEVTDFANDPFVTAWIPRTALDVTQATPRAQDDRRQGPRRESERLLHYAEQTLIATALEWHDARSGETPDVERVLFTSDRLHEAAIRFREARDAMDSPQNPPRQSPPTTVSETDRLLGELIAGESDAGDA